jgi:hypothetical protein
MRPDCCLQWHRTVAEKGRCHLGELDVDGQIKEDEIGKACSTHRGKRNACRILVGDP